MKKLIFIFFLAGMVYAQNTDKAVATATTEKELIRKVVENTNEIMRVGVSGSLNSYARWLSTTGTTVDTVVFGFTPKSVTVINDNNSTDTLFVSSSGSFPSTNTIKRLGGEGFAKYWATDTIFVKVATTPAASKKLRIEAN